MQNYQIFLNQKSLSFIKDKECLNKEQSINVKLFEIRKLSDVDLSLFFDEKDTSDWILICNEYTDVLFSEFKRNFEVIHAAGGLVESSEKDLLFIFRNGVWDLPKGKVEENEDFVTAAVREVEEECGIKHLSVQEKLIETYHFYTLKGKYVLKETHWYKMASDYMQELIPQTEEGITKVEWISKNNLSKVLENTYPNIRILIEKY